MNILQVFGLIILSKQLCLTRAQDNCNCTGGTGSAAQQQPALDAMGMPKTKADWKKMFKMDEDDFLKLKLNEKLLKGSRWTLEQKSVVDVYHSIEVMDATLIHNNELTLRIEFNLRQKWDAEGMEFPKGLFKDSDEPGAFVTANEEVLKDMWAPESYVSTSRESNMNTIGTSLSLVYLFKNSTIVFKVRMYTKVACSSSFQWYPLDIQTCDLMIESYKYHDSIVRYHWTDENQYRPVVVHNRRLFQYELQMPPKYEKGTIVRGGRGSKYSFIRLKFRFERKLGNNLIQVYTPTLLVVVLSWFSFWLGLDAIPGRISLLVTCMLTMVTMHSGMKGSIPPVHYITMMDVWYICCMGFVFSAMCEFVVVKYLHWRHQQKRRAEERKYQEEKMARLYSIFHDHSGGKDRNSNSNGMVINKEYGGKGNGNALPFMDKQTALASSYWTAATAGMRNPSQPLGAEQILQSIIVSEIIGDEAGMGMGSDEECRPQMMNERDKDGVEGGDGEKKRTPIWVSLDRVSRGLLPGLFCLFNVVYWPVLFNASGEQKI